VGWALAMNSPLKYAKRQASHFGGTRTVLVISWPKRIKTRAGCAPNFTTPLTSCRRSSKRPGSAAQNSGRRGANSYVGVSMVYTFDAANKEAKSTRTTQYFEIGGQRAIYSDGWVAANPTGQAVVR